MKFDEVTEGPYRIYAGALEAPSGDGYSAAVIVTLVREGGLQPREVYRDTSLSGGHRWRSARDALAFAMARAREVIRAEQQQLAA
jgi:hypothetical protein